MMLNFFDELMNNRNTSQLNSMNSALQVNCLGCIRMIIAPDINFEFRIAGRTVKGKCFMMETMSHVYKFSVNVVV